jgi:hypothetical protein
MNLGKIPIWNKSVHATNLDDQIQRNSTEQIKWLDRLRPSQEQLAFTQYLMISFKIVPSNSRIKRLKSLDHSIEQ